MDVLWIYGYKWFLWIYGYKWLKWYFIVFHGISIYIFYFSYFQHGIRALVLLGPKFHFIDTHGSW